MSFFQLEKLLKKDKIVVYQSDTIPSIYARINRYQDLVKLKKRNINKPFILLIDSYKNYEQYIIKNFDKKNFKTVSNEKNPITIIFHINQEFINKYHWKYKTVAFRVPKLKKLKKCLMNIGEPIISTSFNLNLQKDNEIIILDGWEKTFHSPSKIYDISKRKYLR